MKDKLKGIYIHIPFCFKKCSFCDFSVYATGIKNIDNNLIKKYEEYLIKEISLSLNFISRNSFFELNGIETLYFGGGTPSLMSISSIQNIYNTIYSFLRKINSNFNNFKECSIELFPDSVNKYYIDNLKSIGFNRCTMGIQSLDNEVLKNLNRSHTVDKSLNAMDLLANSNFSNNYGVDLIQGLPNQKLNSTMNDIEFITKNYKVPHLSIYLLTLEPKSSLFRKFHNQYSSMEYNELTSEMFIKTHQYLNDKYNHYEISNFHRKDLMNPSIHNSNYWKGDNFIGFGMSAFSKMNNIYYKNPLSLKEYFDSIDSLIEKYGSDLNNINNIETFDESEFLKTKNVENISLKEKIKIEMINGIRTNNGINLSKITNILNDSNIVDKIDSIMQSLFKYRRINGNFLQNNDEYYKIYKIGNEEFLKLEFPNTILVSDQILLELFSELNL